MKETSVLSFSTSSTDIGVIEVDPVLNIDSDGNAKSSFDEGEDIYLAVHYDPALYNVTNFETTTGSILFVGRQRTYRDLGQIFFQEATNTSQYIIDEIKKVTYYGPEVDIGFSYNVLTTAVIPTMVDISIYTYVDIYKYIPSTYVDLETFDSFPVGVIFTLETV